LDAKKEPHLLNEKRREKGADYDTVIQDLEENDRTIGGDLRLRGMLASQFQTAQNALRYMSLDWDEYEDLLFVQSRTPDNSKIRLSEGSLSTIVIERAGRVMSKLPRGTVHAFGLQNQGKGQLMDLLLEKWIYPNANYQYDLETKLFMWDMYSNVYGTMPMCYDWTYTQNYTGPDCWLVPIRNFFPQQGRFSMHNCDYVFISNYISRDYLEDLVENEVTDYDLDAIAQVLEKTKQGKTRPTSYDDYLRHNPMFQYRRRAVFTDTGEIEVVTKYEAGDDGRWIDFLPDFGNLVIRNIPNPHQNGKIPVVLKYAMPTLDSVIGLGDMEKGRYAQYAIDTVTNLLVDGIKLRTYPPIKVLNGNVVMPTVRFQPGAKWLVSNPNDISHHQFPDVDGNNNLTFQMLQGIMSNITGQTTTRASGESNTPTEGKTPQAIKAQNASQSTRDDIDSKFMDKSIEELFNGMISLINDVEHDEPIELYMFNDEIAEIAASYPDIKDAVKISPNGKTAKITIKPSRIKNEKGYIYKINPRSTYMDDLDAQHEQLLEIHNTLMSNPGVMDDQLAKNGMAFDYGEYYKELLMTGGLRDVKKLLRNMTPQQQQSYQQQKGLEQQRTMQERMDIKDLPPAAAAQMANRAGLQVQPQDFMQNQIQKMALETQSKVEVAQAKNGEPVSPMTQQSAMNGMQQPQQQNEGPMGLPMPQTGYTVPGSPEPEMGNINIGNPDIAQAIAHIRSTHGRL